MSTTDYTSSDPYIGVWTNWARGKVHGSTLTLPRREAGLLTAFLAIYVSAVGGQFWRIVCYTFHQARAGQTARRGDTFHRQIQVLLRNSEGAGGGLWEFARLPFQWRHWGTSTLLSCSLFALLAFVNLSAFGTASIFSSAVAKAAGNETLINSKNCGFAKFPDTLDPTFSKLLRVMHLSQSAAGYARACYGDVDNLLQCTTYPQRQIKYQALRNATCPFESHRCLNNLAVAFDTGELDTFKVFGVNSPPNERLIYRRLTTCAPIYVDDIRKVETVADDSRGITEEVENIYAGPTRSGYSPLNASAPTYSRSRRPPAAGLGYTFETTFSAAGGTWAPWAPIQSLNRTDADVTIFFITFNNIEFVGANDDPIFSAHIDSTSGLGVPVRKPDQNVSVLACAEQNQWCNPNVAQGSPSRCTPLTASELVWGHGQLEDIRLLQETGQKRLHNTSISLSPFQEVVASYASTANSVGMYFSTFSRGVSALKAAETVFQNIQSPIPNDQWIIELSKWFETGLAGFQQSALEFAMGPQYLGESGVLERIPANDTLVQRLCQSQLIRGSGQVQSFSMLGIVLILTLGGLILILSVTMESTVGALQGRLGVGQHRRMEWLMDEKLHLIANREDAGGGAEMTLGGGSAAAAAASRSSVDMVRGANATFEKGDNSQVALIDLGSSGFDRKADIA